MEVESVVLITGTRKGIGRFLAEYYARQGHQTIGVSRGACDLSLANYTHFCLDIRRENQVQKLFTTIRKTFNRLDVLINNAGIASMNHLLLTPVDTAQRVLDTNVMGTFLMCREAAKLMRRNRFGRIVNFSTVASPLKLEGEAIYACSKAAVEKLTEILARELADFGITVNAIGPTPVETDLIASVPKEKIESLVNRQAIRRFAEFQDISNVIDFFIKPESSFLTGQTLYLGGVS